MLHTNHGELFRIFDTFCRVWGAGGQATLTTSTQGGLVKANLDVQLGPPTAASPGAPPLHQQRQNAWTSTFSSSAPGHPGAAKRRRRRRHRGPAAIARSKARAAAHQASLAAAKSGTAPVLIPPPPLPPPASTQRLIKVVERKAGSRPSFCQLDGEGGSVVESEEETEGEDKVAVDGVVYCIFCNVDAHEPYPVEPTSFLDNYGMKPIVNVYCKYCKIKGSDVGVCYDCHCCTRFFKDGRRTCRLCQDAIED